MTNPRRCRRCCEEKPLSEFEPNPGYGDTHLKVCRACRALPEEYRVYVIELSDEAGPRQTPTQPHVYVGQTSTLIECRYWQHQNKINSSSKVRRWGVRLRPDLYAHLPILESRQEAESLELQTMKELRRRGFTVHGG